MKRIDDAVCKMGEETFKAAGVRMYDVERYDGGWRFKSTDAFARVVRHIAQDGFVVCMECGGPGGPLVLDSVEPHGETHTDEMIVCEDCGHTWEEEDV